MKKQLYEDDELTVREINFKADIENNMTLKQLADKYHKSIQTMSIWKKRFEKTGHLTKKNSIILNNNDKFIAKIKKVSGRV